MKPTDTLSELTRLRLLRDPRMLERFRLCYEWLATMPRATRRWLSRSFRRKLAMTLAAAALLIALSGTPLYAASITVDPGAAGINPGDGCSLVEAIINANNDAATYAECVAGSGADTITLPAAASLSYTVSYGTDAALPDVSDVLTIEGQGSTIQRAIASPNFRILNVYSTDFTLNETTLSGGLTDLSFVSDNGGGIYVYHSDAILNDSFLTGNAADTGGGAYVAYGSLTLNNVGVSTNYADDGGGIAAYGSDVTVNDSSITGNTAEEAGGGIAFAPDGTLTINRTTISGNTAYAAGGVISYGYSVIANSTITNNTAVYAGGIANVGFFLGGGYTMLITNSTVSGNHATAANGELYAAGGGIYNAFGNVVLNQSTVSGNNADVYGGGIVNGPFYHVGGGAPPARIDGAAPNGKMHSAQAGKQGKRGEWYKKGKFYAKHSAKFGSKPTTAERAPDKKKPEAFPFGNVFLVNSTISGNSADQGGGIANYLYLSLVNVTMTDNTATSFGGAISTAGVANFQRSLISGNTAPEGAEIDACNCFIYTAADFNLFGHSGETNAQAFYYFTPGLTDINATSDGDGGTSTHIATPLGNILNTTLALNGGTTMTNALLANSPALDRAPNAECNSVPTDGIDQRGLNRNVNATGGPSSNECDIGAFELQATTPRNLSGFKGHIGKAGNVAVKWRTTTETEIAGFNIWRRLAGTSKDAFKQVNGELLQSKHPGDAAGNAYRFKDKSVRPGKVYRYKIEIKYLDGHSQWSDVIQMMTPK